MDTSGTNKIKFEKIAITSVLSVFAAMIFILFSDFLSSEYASEDLPAHAEITRRMLNAGQLIFYDRFWFSGWPAFQFYGFIPHLFAALFSLLGIADIEQSIRIISLLACSFLPFSFYFCSSKMASRGILSALIAGALSVWLLTLDEQFYGIGLGSILGVGLYPQVFGWHCILLSLGSIFSKSKYLPILIAVSLLSHTLSGVVVVLLCLMWFLLNNSERKYIAISLLLGLGLISFWLYPFLKYNADFTSADVYRMPRDWLSLLFRYPLTELSIDRILKGEIQIFRLLFILITAVLTLFWNKFENKNFKNLIISILLLTIFTSSNYIAASNFLALHYYRIDGLIILPVLMLFAYVLTKFSDNSKLRSIILALVLIAALYNLIQSVPDNVKRIRLTKADPAISEVLNFLRDSKSRIFVEFNNDYKKVAYYSGHLLESKITDKEIANGLFVESSNTSRYLSFSADILGGASFHGYLVFIGDSDIDQSSALKQLQSFSIQTIVASSEKFAKNLEALVGPAVFTSGVYRVFNLSASNPESLALIQEINKPIVGYLDLSRKLPFTLVAQYFYTRQKLFNNFELIDLSKINELTENIQYLMINGEQEKIKNYLSFHKTHAKLIPFYEKAEILFTESRKNYPVDKKVEVFKRIKSFFDNKLRLETRLELAANQAIQNTELTADWQKNNLVLSSLKAGKLYRVNYSYSPLFHSDSMEIFRAGQERTIVIPKKDGKHVISFSVFNMPGYILSILVSVISLVTVSFMIRTDNE